MDKEKFAKAIARFDYEDAERILKDADEDTFDNLICQIIRDWDENVMCNPNSPYDYHILQVSLMGFLIYLEERGWEKVPIYHLIITYLALPPLGLYCICGAEALGIYYCFKLIQEDDCLENLTMLHLYDYPCTLIDDKTQAYIARKSLRADPNNEAAAYWTELSGFVDGDINFSDTMLAAPFGTADIDGVAICYEEFEKRLYRFKFAAAAAILAHPDLDEQTRQEWLVAVTPDVELLVYAFLMYLLDEGCDKPRVYRWFVVTLLHANVELIGDGAYGLALYYCRKLVAEEETLENLRLLLSFVDVPGDFMGRDEAEDVARRILALDANDAKARDVLELVGGEKGKEVQHG